jgi:CDP-glycerol glycerophosphotransferase (TagB/SpsB family)
MNKLENINYDYFISTSDWTNETNFKKIFSAKSFLNLGYPRNDIFFKDEDELDLMFCDRKIYEIAKKSFKKVILYMPTHRENQTKLNLDFQKLNQKLQEIDAIFILKLHPFMLDYYKNSGDLEYSNLFFHNAHGDIYPILKYVDTLVSDYSSVVYDFLLLDREVIFYNYDMDEYLKNVSLLFDYDEFSPGVKVKTQDELEKAISKQDAKDEYGKKREEIKELFFDKIARGGALKNIINILAKDSM